MPKISRNKMDPKIYNSILKHLMATVADLKDETKVTHLMDGLFTRTEKLMLSKRLAIAALLEEGVSYGDISRLLKVSSVTIGFVKNNVINNRPAYAALIKAIHKINLNINKS